MHLSEEKQDKICSLFLDMMRRLDALFASQVRLRTDRAHLESRL